MQLVLIEDRQERAAARKAYMDRLCEAWTTSEKRTLTYQGASPEMKIFHNGTYWVAPKKLVKEIIPRSWDAFGMYKKNGNLRIAVEINIPQDPSKEKIAGFFARDTESGACYLMHSGGVKGGAGVTRAGFLALSREKPVPVMTSSGDVRWGVILTAVGSNAVEKNISRFIESVAKFKEDVKGGRLSGVQKKKVEKFERYSKEFSGEVKRRAIRETEYKSRHGDIVDALRELRKKFVTGNDEAIGNHNFTDLRVLKNRRLTEVYEVKTGCSRGELCKAIGQVIVNSEKSRNGCKRFLVLPKERIASDVMRALSKEGINIVRYKLTKKRITFTDMKGKPFTPKG
ncbi:MAG: hypothetical protein ACYYKD_01520 [Rhodospirillales bacterium]